MAALVVSAAGGSGVLTGCAGERDPINRVQVNAIPKSLLVGDKYDDPSDDPSYYARSMIINVPYGQSASDVFFANGFNSSSKIKWQITEKQLLGRITFERITGTDGQGPTPTQRDNSKSLAQNEGLVVYAFPIESQFDIRRDYNSSTGEETNVVVENSSDRPWFQRDYVRVDFSQNLVTTAYDFDELALYGLFDGIDYSPISYDVRDPNDENAPVMDLETGYFDVTNKVFANPHMLDLGGGFKLPACYLPNLVQGGSQPVGNCNPNEITLRHSFKRVIDNDYEAADWDGKRFEAYGSFYKERHGFARDYGMPDTEWHRFISRYNIWDRSHAYKDADKMEGPTQCKVDDDCANVGGVVGISHCDTFAEKCTLPFRDRKAKPIVWHYTKDSPDFYFGQTLEATEEWDAVIRQAVLTAKYAECKRFTPDQDCGNPITGNYAEEENLLYLVKEINACKRGEVQGTPVEKCNDLAQELGSKRGYSDATIQLAQSPKMVVLCHSPVSEGDDEACGEKGLIVRRGDLRYNLITNIPEPATGAPWGIMTDMDDPQTGEKVSTSVNVWTNDNEFVARRNLDILRYIAGEYTTADITEGTYINNWVEAQRLMKNGVAPIMGADETDKRVAAATGTTVEALHAAEAASGKNKLKSHNTVPASADARNIQALRTELQKNLKRVQHQKAAIDEPSRNEPMYAARANMIKGTPLEATAVTPAMQQLMKSSFGAVDANMTTQMTSIFQGMNPTMRRNLQRTRELSMVKRGMCAMPSARNAETAPLGFVALGDILQQKFGKFNPKDAPDVQQTRADKMFDWLRRRYLVSVIGHEMGHSFGLRHNFVSSSDAWNFRPQYWQLRTNDKKNNENDCKEGDDGKACVGPRWLDPETDNERANLLEMFTSSSTMEYPGEQTQDLLNLGRYDFAAGRMFYGDVATVYNTDDRRFKAGADAGNLAQDHQDDFGGLLGYRYGDFNAPTHYSKLDATVNLIEKCSKVSTDDFRPVNWNDDKDGQWHPVLDGHIVKNESGTYTRCTEPKVDFVQWTQLKDDTEANKYMAKDSQSRIRVPHGFASDEWADIGNVTVYRHDNGADEYELMQFWQATQEANHIFTNYRRGRTDFSVWGAFSGTLARYHEKMRDTAKGIALYATLARDTVSLYQAGQDYGGQKIAGDPQGFAAEILKEVAPDNVVASSIAFDHFAHVYARPQPGNHGSLGTDDNVLRWQADDSQAAGGFATGGRVVLTIPNGVQGTYGTISVGGRPIENALSNDHGRDYDRDYTLNVGSYYEKAFTAMLFTESADNFISASRDDFVDPRFRAISLADVFPEGFRRWFANNLTGDDAIKGVFTRGTGTSTPAPPELDQNGYATIGYTSWWPTAGVEACFPNGTKTYCRDPFGSTPIASGAGVGPVIDPQVGWEQQKFATLFTLLYLPENQRTNWLDQMRIWEIGEEPDPGFDNRIEFHDPTGRIWVAQTFGTETLFGKTVQKGVAARVLEYANELLNKGVDCTATVGKTATWYVPKMAADGTFTYKTTDGAGGSRTAATCDNSMYCTKMKNYTSVPKFLREAQKFFGYTPGIGNLKGVY